MKVLRLTTIRLGQVREITSYLSTLQTAYDNLYAFDLVVEDAKERYGEYLEENSWSRRKRQVHRRTLRRIRDASAIVLPQDRLRLRSVVVQSPGFWEFVGSLNPLETLRKYLADRHDRQKDREYRSRLEAERMTLENEKLKTAVARDSLDLLKQLGIPEDRIREIATRHLVKPLSDLDRAQDVGLIENAEFLDVEESEDPTDGRAG